MRDGAFTALTVLTGHQEAKNNPIAWARWWRANRVRFVFTDQKPELSKQQAQTWTQTWQLPGTETETKPGKQGESKGGSD